MKSTIHQTALPRDFAEVLKDYYQLTKPGITLAVLISMVIGFMLGSSDDIDLWLMFHAIIGTYLIAAGTAAHNQFLERRLDGLMKRTEKRPLPDNRLAPKNSVKFSLFLIFAGLLYLVSIVNVVAGLISLATAAIYLGAYTPLKQKSAINIFVGSIPGALPPVGGWAAAGGSLLEPSIWLIFAIVFFWQVPHVLAIAWMCKDDYGNAGFKMLPKNDESGVKTSFWVLLCTAALFPVTIQLYFFEVTSFFFLAFGLLLASAFLYFGIRFSANRTKPSAKSLMLYSIAYLPAVWLTIFLDFAFF